MARVNRMSVQKRLRERKKAEKAELKREMRNRRGSESEDEEERTGSSAVATRDDLEGYGLITDPEEDSEEAQ
jgi:hypothetical protein